MFNQEFISPYPGTGAAMKATADGDGGMPDCQRQLLLVWLAHHLARSRYGATRLLVTTFRPACLCHANV